MLCFINHVSSRHVAERKYAFSGINGHFSLSTVNTFHDNTAECITSQIFSLHLSPSRPSDHHGATDGGAQQDITTKRIPLSLPGAPDFFCVCGDRLFHRDPAPRGLLELV